MFCKKNALSRMYFLLFFVLFFCVLSINVFAESTINTLKYNIVVNDKTWCVNLSREIDQDEFNNIEIGVKDQEFNNIAVTSYLSGDKKSIIINSPENSNSSQFYYLTLKDKPGSSILQNPINIKFAAPKSPVSSSKVWNIKLNHEITKDALNNIDVNVTDENSSVVSTTVSLDKNNKTIIVTPNSEYKSGGTYNLNIKNRGSSTLLKSSIEKSFYVENTSKNSVSKNFMWIWQIQDLVDRYGSIDNVISKLKSIGITNVCIKYHEGSSEVGGGINYKDAFLKYKDNFKNAGFTVGTWGYNYFNNIEAESGLINEALDNSDYYIFDVEDTVAGKADEADKVCENVRSKHPNSTIGYSSFPIVSYHSNVPYSVFNKYCDFASPQCYWGEMESSVNNCIDSMIQNYKNFNLDKPIYPSIQTYGIDMNSYSTYSKYNFTVTGAWDLDSMDDNFCNFVNNNGNNQGSNQTSDDSSTKTGIVTASALNIRSGGGMQYSIIDSAPKGTKVIILGSESGWYNVKLPDGQVGWASANYIQ